MARNNVKLLTETQLSKFNKRYTFELNDDKVVVKINGYDRKTEHPVNQPFEINAKRIRKICFSIQAIDIWIEFQKQNLSWTLVETQQAVNKLYIMYQPITTENVKNILLSQTQQIRKI